MAKGLCAIHYARWSRNGTTERLRHACKGHVCATEDCGRPAYCRGLCANCYHRWLRNGTTERRRQVNVGRTCAEPGCGQQARVRGLCSACYQRWRYRQRAASASRVVRPTCRNRHDPSAGEHECIFCGMSYTTPRGSVSVVPGTCSVACSISYQAGQAPASSAGQRGMVAA